MNTKNNIGYQISGKGTQTFQAINPATQEALPGDFVSATEREVNEAVALAHAAWETYRNTSGAQKAQFLRAIADEIEALGDTLVERACQESGLPAGRITGERGRTCNQLRLFAKVVEEGHWVDAVIDPPLPDRQPLPRVDIRRMLQAMGPVVVFTASNFPLAFSTAGGDTASALAAGCPVIVKAHPAHPGTNALVSAAILKAAQKNDMPEGVYSSILDSGYQAGTQLVQHPQVKAVAFTGSLRGGMALHKAAMEREAPIPVFAEMGSVNPVFLMPAQLQQDAEGMAQQMAASVTLGAGQFCTNPGLVFVLDDADTDAFASALEAAMQKTEPATMLNEGIFQNYEARKEKLFAESGVEPAIAVTSEEAAWKGCPAVAQTSAEQFISNPLLHEEVFGPLTLLVRCKDYEEMKTAAAELAGQLTATIMGPEDQLSAWQELIDILTQKVGRLIFNGVPTGVEVGYAMQHGGPFPATTDSRFTSVGTNAIKRFARPVAWQNCPDALLPPALQRSNPLGLVRTVDGVIGKGKG
jgi:NADP-dependent aldehyde dehydrogenase